MPTTSEPLWIASLASPPAGLCLAREPGWALTWDEAGWLYLFNQQGSRQAQYHFPERIVAAALADTAAFTCVLGASGRVQCLGPDFSLRGEHRLGRPGLSLAIDPFANFCAVSDDASNIHLLNPAALTVVPPAIATPRPIVHLAFVPQQATLIGCADFGLLLALGVQGQALWRDTPLANIGALSVDGSGESILLAMFSEGIQRWNRAGKKQSRLATPKPCRLVAQAYEGQRILSAGMANEWWLVDALGNVLLESAESAPVVGVALSPLADRAWLTRADKQLVCYQLKE